MVKKQLSKQRLQFSKWHNWQVYSPGRSSKPHSFISGKRKQKITSISNLAADIIWTGHGALVWWLNCALGKACLLQSNVINLKYGSSWKFPTCPVRPTCTCSHIFLSDALDVTYVYLGRLGIPQSISPRPAGAVVCTCVDWKCVFQSIDVHVCGSVEKRHESFCFVNEKSMVTLTTSAPNFIWTLQSEEEDGGHCSPCLNQSSVCARRVSRTQKHPLKFQLTRRGTNRYHLGLSDRSANRWSFQIQTQILTLHFSYIYWLTRKPRLRARQ